MGRLLVTGANGLVGSQFNGDIIAINSKVCDLRNKEATEYVINFYAGIDTPEYAVDKIIHCAGKVGGLGSNMKYKGEFFYDNLMINTNVIEAARKAGIKKLVAFLSTCIFPDKVDYPLRENKIHLGPPHESNDAYAYAKRMAQVQISAYREQYGLDYKCVIPTNIYGPGDEKERIVPRTIKLILQGKNPEIFNDAVTRDYMYIDDAVSGYVLLAEKIPELTKNHGNIIYNFGSGTHYSSKTVVETIIRLMDRPQIKPIYIAGDRKQEVINQYVSIEKIQSTLGWKPQYSLEEGLKKTIQWWLEKGKNKHATLAETQK